MEFETVDAVPPSTTAASPETLEVIRAMGDLEVDGIVKIPVSTLDKKEREKALRKYYGGTIRGRKQFPNLKFRVFKREQDLYIKRIE